MDLGRFPKYERLVGVGDVFMVWCRDKVSVRAEGWLGFMYYVSNLLVLKLRPGPGLRKKSKVLQKIIQNFRPYRFICAQFCQSMFKQNSLSLEQRTRPMFVSRTCFDIF